MIRRQNEDLIKLAAQEREAHSKQVSTVRGIIDLARKMHESANYRSVTKFDWCPSLKSTYGAVYKH